MLWLLKSYCATKLQKARNMNSYKEAIRRLEEVSVSSKGEERVQLLRRWLVSLREIERQNAVSTENDEKNSKEICTPNDKNHSPGNPDVLSEKILPYFCRSAIFHVARIAKCAPVNL